MTVLNGMKHKNVETLEYESSWSKEMLFFKS